MLYERMKKEAARLSEKVGNIEKELQHLPEGKFICSHSDKQRKWFVKLGDKKTYIPKKQKSYAEKLAWRKYLTALLTDYKKELSAINMYLRHHNSDMSELEKLSQKSPGTIELISDFHKPISKILEEWMREPYNRYMGHPEHLIHKTPSGNVVRSKSEALIESYLTSNKIPFRYECILQKDSNIFVPDFTIRHPLTGETFYWEHLGRMDDPVYFERNMEKIKSYAQYGIIPGKNLILTFETSTSPLTAEMIYFLVQYYFM